MTSTLIVFFMGFLVGRIYQFVQPVSLIQDIYDKYKEVKGLVVSFSQSKGMLNLKDREGNIIRNFQEEGVEVCLVEGGVHGLDENSYLTLAFTTPIRGSKNAGYKRVVLNVLVEPAQILRERFPEASSEKTWSAPGKKRVLTGTVALSDDGSVEDSAERGAEAISRLGNMRKGSKKQ